MTFNNGVIDRAKLNTWFSESYKTLEDGKGYCDLDLWAVQRQGMQRVISFCDENGYTYIQNDKANRFRIYNFKRSKVRDKFPELCSYH